MLTKLRRIAQQLLVASIFVIAFLLIFETKLVIPTWLQPLGRMHPLMLHFPIVLLLIAIVMEFFRYNSQNANNIYYRNFLDDFLLIGSLSAGITVVMGLFLSREEGYTGSTLQWHKWTGAAIFFLSALIYLSRSSKWYNQTFAKASTLLIAIGLVLTGHYGAALTHGENFVLEPILKNRVEAVPLEKAMVYEDVIKPIFEQKCTSCHNPEKIKGELILSDPESIKKGGKSGKLFVAGNPQISLLMQRLHLPMEDKKHMPPSGKTQLTADEIVLLSLWVKGQADFKKKLIDLPATDSLRLIATKKFTPAEAEDVFDFSSAKEETVLKLNNDYRTVAPLARESPALSVNIYNRSAFNSKQLEELEEVRDQIVSLNLNKMPVKDEHLKQIGKLKNLRRLDLNFTEVTANGLKEVSSLKHLKHIALSGTALNFKDFSKQLPAFKALKTVTLWETPFSLEEIKQLQKDNPRISFESGFKDDGKNPLKLNTPQIQNSTVVFAGQTPLQLKHPIKGVDLRFTMDGTIPDSINSPLFDGKTILRDNAVVNVKAFKKGWYGSDMATFDFFKSTFIPDSVRLDLPLNRVHQAEGAHTFFDKKLGVIGANNPAWANNWAGVRNNDILLVSEFKKPVLVSSVGMHYMIEEDTGIFPPELIEIWGGNDPAHLKLLGKAKSPMPVKGDKPTLKLVEAKFKGETVTYLKIVAKPLSSIPEWHRNKGGKALLLIDEMFIN